MERERRPLWMTLWLAAGCILLVGVMLSDDTVERIVAEERRDVFALLGQHAAERADALAGRWYRNIVVPPGASPARTLESMGVARRWLLRRVRVLEVMARQLLFRAALLLAWIPAIVAILAAAAWDGLMAWRARRRSFAYASPLAQRAALGILSVALPLMVGGLFAPIALHPWMMMTAWMIVPAAALRLFVASLPKRI